MPFFRYSDFVQGPCAPNQQALIESKLYLVVNKLFQHGFADCEEADVLEMQVGELCFLLMLADTAMFPCHDSPLLPVEMSELMSACNESNPICV